MAYALSFSISLEASTGRTRPNCGFALGSNAKETLNSSDPIGQENGLRPKDFCTGVQVQGMERCSGVNVNITKLNRNYAIMVGSRRKTMKRGLGGKIWETIHMLSSKSCLN